MYLLTTSCSLLTDHPQGTVILSHHSLTWKMVQEKNINKQNLMELFNRNSHNCKSRSAPLFRKRNGLVIRNSAQQSDQCPEFGELEVELPRFNRNINRKCLYRHQSEGLTQPGCLQAPRREENQLGQFPPQPWNFKEKKKSSYLALPGGWQVLEIGFCFVSVLPLAVENTHQITNVFKRVPFQ